MNAAVRTIRPLGKRVLVRPMKAADKEGSLYIPEQAKEQPMEGTLVSASPESKYANDGDFRALCTDLGLDYPKTFVGASVLYSKYVGTEVTEGGETFLLIRDDDILAVLE